MSQNVKGFNVKSSTDEDIGRFPNLHYCTFKLQHVDFNDFDMPFENIRRWIT